VAFEDRRSEQAQAYRRLYGLAKWKRTRKAQLDKQPLCEKCLKAGRLTPATVCDHIDPSTKLSPDTFFLGPFQSLCDAYPWRCHSSDKQREEQGSAPMPVIGLDGWPEGA
jgi:5-methylcytosine-specific restriction protein A